MILLEGDLFDRLLDLEPDSIDACVTDPPYGIGFMGKKWDSFKPGQEAKRIVPNQQANSANPNLKGRTRSPASSPSAVEYDRTLSGQQQFQAWTEQWAVQALRVLKPGAHMLVCGAPRSFHRMTCGLEDAGFEIRDCFSWLYGQGFPKSLNVGGGRGTALKPAWEPILLARKPLDSTIVECVATHETGALSIDACRITTTDIIHVPQSDPSKRQGAVGTDLGITRSDKDKFQAAQRASIQRTMDLGRWPTNALFDEDSALQLGEVSRFFYCAKTSRSERDFGCVDLPSRSGGEATGRVDDSAGTKSPRAGAGRTGGSKNFHPTVKPLALMRYLVRLITPPNGYVLDPFAGSGSTGIACAAEGFECVLIEREAEYIPIIEARVGAAESHNWRDDA